MTGLADLEPVVLAILALRLFVVAVVVGMIVRGYLRRRRRRGRVLAESRRWLQNDDAPEDEDDES